MYMYCVYFNDVFFIYFIYLYFKTLIIVELITGSGWYIGSKNIIVLFLIITKKLKKNLEKNCNIHVLFCCMIKFVINNCIQLSKDTSNLYKIYFTLALCKHVILKYFAFFKLLIDI